MFHNLLLLLLFFGIYALRDFNNYIIYMILILAETQPEDDHTGKQI